MNRSRTSAVIVLLALVSLLILGATAVYAGSASVSGTFPAGGSPTMPVVFISPPNCTGQGASLVQYHAVPFSVDTAGIYTLDLAIASGNLSLYLMTSAFNPAAGFPTCLSGDNNDPISVSFALAANTTYIAVPIDDSFGQAGGSYTLTISGPGNVYIAGQGGAPSIDDGRLNKYDMAATFAVYCSADGFDVYAIDSAGHGHLAIRTTAGEVEAVDASAANALIAEGMGIRAFKLTTGEVQIVGAPDFEGKVYNVLFYASGCSLIDTFLN